MGKEAKVMLKEKVNSFIAKQEGGENKKKIENLVVFVLILIITVIAINSIWNGKKQNSSKEENEISEFGKQLATTSNVESSDTSNSQTTLEERLEEILSKIDGVGQVKVLITYSESSEVVAMYNENNKNSTIEEKDSGGGTRLTEQLDNSKEIIYKEVNGEKIPITQKVIRPKVEGAIVTAVGANDVNVKNCIIQAVEAVTGIATHKIQVFEMNKN